MVEASNASQVFVFRNPGELRPGKLKYGFLF